jgi:predicted RNA polymerase sigma factor
VEHFFRHEFGQLVAVLTRSLGVRRLDLVEDVVQAALVQALETWSRRAAIPPRLDWKPGARDNHSWTVGP